MRGGLEGSQGGPPSSTGSGHPTGRPHHQLAPLLSAVGRPVAKGGLAVVSTGSQGVGGTSGAASSANWCQLPCWQAAQERPPKESTITQSRLTKQEGDI